MQVPNDLLTESLIDFISTIFGAEQAILPLERGVQAADEPLDPGLGMIS